MTQQMNPNIQLDLQSMPSMECEHCSHDKYKQIFIMKKVSALVSPTGKETIVPIQLFACDSCGEVPSAFDKETKDTEENPMSPGKSMGKSNELYLGNK